VTKRDRRSDEYSTCTLDLKKMGRPSERGKPRHRLVVFIDDDLTTHLLPRSGQVTIGRSRSADVFVDHLSVSRRHAEIRITEGRLEVVDLGSHNGTRLGGRELVAGAPTPLKLGDVFEVGAATLIVQQSEIETGPPTPRPEPVAGQPVRTGVYFGEWLAQAWPMIERVAAGEIPVLLMGETGVGKEVLVELIHEHSHRSRGPLISVNCAAIPPSLIESELFGHEKGAFTDATSSTQGLLERADRGILFLDEVGELPTAMQAKLLRVLESKEVQRVGGTRSWKVDVRVVTATNRDLERLVQEGGFRQDLLYRINAFTLVIPPLRERRAEIEGLARHFLAKAWDSARGPTPDLSPEAIALLRSHEWPGNIRELRNVIERVALLCDGTVVLPRHLPPHLTATHVAATLPADAPLRDTVREAERQRIVEALEASKGNQTRAAELLGVSRRTLISRLDDYGLPRPRKGR
jgi:transcriptional regulator of acetoin/glycerol metabolism